MNAKDLAKFIHACSGEFANANPKHYRPMKPWEKLRPQSRRMFQWVAKRVLAELKKKKVLTS